MRLTTEHTILRVTGTQVQLLETTTMTKILWRVLLTCVLACNCAVVTSLSEEGAADYPTLTHSIVNDILNCSTTANDDDGDVVVEYRDSCTGTGNGSLSTCLQPRGTLCCMQAWGSTSCLSVFPSLLEIIHTSATS